MEKLILEMEILDAKNPMNPMDDSNFKGVKDGMYAIFDGLNYQMVHRFNGMCQFSYIIPARYINIVNE